jgi:ATP-dependent DNA helicase RecG
MKELVTQARYIKGVGPKKAELLEKLGIISALDLLFFFPRAYSDRRDFTPIEKLAADTTANVSGEISDARVLRYGGSKSRIEATISDGTDSARVVWFNQAFLAKHIVPGVKIRLTGAVGFHGGIQLVPEEWEIVREGEGDSLNFGRIVPIYRLTSGLGQKELRRITRSAVDEYAGSLEEFLPPDLVKRKRFPPLHEAIRDIHWPHSSSAAQKAIARMKFDELFLLELVLALTREHVRRADGNSIAVTPEIDARIRARFPFKFTAAQNRVIEEIKADLASKAPMNRLLQGDVGSGKTAVALYALLAAIARGYQAAVMAPTEILAEQHYLTFRRLLSGSRTNVALITGGEPASSRNPKLAAVLNGEAHIAVGTHALIQETVAFKNLGLVIVDEQHKFGVMQRARLKEKGRIPDMLVMTATPIPRTLAMTAFGDLDVSILDEMPPGRGKVVTKWLGSGELAAAYEMVRGELLKGRQAFIVYPVIEDSDALDLKGASESRDRIQKEVFPDFKVGLLHGALPPEEKDRIMNDFRDGAFHVLVATVVIEVGIDIPNATAMLIEHADRFGLAQLHQLRGRIGRGGHDAVCIVVGEAKTRESADRLKTFSTISDGFRIAEEDLRIRGPGEFLGTRQHGLPELRVADILTDYAVLVEARNLADEIARTNPALAGEEFKRLNAILRARFSERMKLLGAG